MEVSLVPPYGLACQCSRALPRIPHVDIAIPPLEKVGRNLEYRAAAQNSGWKGPSLFSVEEKSALNKGRPDLEKVSSEKWPLLHTAATSGDTFIVDRLIKSGADVNTLDKDGYSALQRAVMAKKEMSVNQLLQAKADAFIHDKGGATLLHYGVQTGSMNIVRWFIECGVEVNSSDKYGWTPLHLAVLTGRADIVRLLLVRGADKNLKNKDGWTSLDLCFALGGPFNSVEVAKALKTYPKVKVKTGMI